MDVSVIITCWNGRELLKKNLPAVVLASRNPENKIKEIIVVDDYSSDGSVEFLEENFPTVKVIRHERNYGYSVTANTGVSQAENDLVAILNTDVVPAKNFLKAVLPHFRDEKVFAVSFNEGKYGPGRLVWKKGFWEMEATKPAPTVSLGSWASGGSAVFRKSIWQKLGGMDRLFLPFYYEDVDLGLRAARAGFKCLWEPGAEVIHQHEATINSESFSPNYINRIKQRNHLLLTWRNLGNPERFFSHLFYLFLRCLSHPGYFKIVFSAAFRKEADSPKISPEFLREIWRKVPVDYYEEGVRKNLGQKIWHFRKFAVVREAVSHLTPLKILDIGSNGGVLTSRLAGLFPQAQVVGIDVYEEAVKHAQSRHPAIAFRVADAQKLPFKEKEFDLIFCLETLEHIVLPAKALSEMKRCLKDSGRIVISMDSGSSLFSLIWFFWTRFGRGRVWDGSHLWKFDRQKLKKMILEEKFVIESEKVSHLGMAVTFVVRKS